MASQRKRKQDQPVNSEQIVAMRRELEDLKRDISDHKRDIEDCQRDVSRCRKDVDDAVKTRPVWLLIILAVLGFLGYTSWSGIKGIQTRLLQEAERRLQEQVTALYDEKHVAQVVDQIVRSDANDSIRRIVEDRVTPILNALEQKQGEVSQAVAAIQNEQVRYAQITEMHYLIVSAQAGDVKAFKTLCQIADGANLELSAMARQVTETVVSIYFGSGKARADPLRNVGTDSNIRVYLQHSSNTVRTKAIYTVRERKIYDQIPFLIDQIPKENSMDVYSAIKTTLNELLGVEYNIFDPDAQLKYTEAWAQKKSSLLTGEQEAP